MRRPIAIEGFDGDVLALDVTDERSVRAGYNHLTWLENDSDFDPIRQHPRFRALVKQIADHS